MLQLSGPHKPFKEEQPAMVELIFHQSSPLDKSLLPSQTMTSSASLFLKIFEFFLYLKLYFNIFKLF
jgi:hypothetical protein